MTSSPTTATRPKPLSAPLMLQASPQHYEFVMKLRVPVFYSILPRFLQRIVCQFSCLRFLAPSWERRFLILLGGYLYKFTQDNDPTKEPKGTPVAIDTVDINLINLYDDDENYHDHILFSPPPACQGLFQVATLRKRHYYATATAEDATTWVNALRQARQEAIKRHMGHAPTESYPPRWKSYDALGKALANRKDRVRRRLHESRLKELELSSLDGAVAPRGYYG